MLGLKMRGTLLRQFHILKTPLEFLKFEGYTFNSFDHALQQASQESNISDQVRILNIFLKAQHKFGYDSSSTGYERRIYMQGSKVENLETNEVHEQLKIMIDFYNKFSQ